MPLERYMSYDPTLDPGTAGQIIGTGSIGGKAKGLVFAARVVRDLTRRGGGAGTAGDTGTVTADGTGAGSTDHAGTGTSATTGAMGIAAAGIEIPEARFIADGVFEEFLHINHLPPPGMEPLGETTLHRFHDAQLPGWLWPHLYDLVTRMDFPLAVRSSSRLEDSPHASFAGKYLTVFLPNNGSPDERVAALAAAIRQVYASTYGPDASEYRRRHGLSGDAMAVIVQRLAGRRRGRYFYPELAGVGHSRNYRRWTERIQVEDGVMRVVFGLGTRSTGRGYARVICPAHPRLRPEGHDPAAMARYAQEVVDVLDLKAGVTRSVNINDEPGLAFACPGGPGYLQVYDAGRNELRSARGHSWLDPGEKYVFTFPALERYARQVMDTTTFLFRLLEEEMGMPVDLEFAAEPAEGWYYLVQARPLWSWEEYRPVQVPADARGVILRGNRMLSNGEMTAHWLVMVDPGAYAATADKYAVARAVGEINRRLAGERYILVGPGRWGSTNPALGVPVHYQEISNCGVLVEIGTTTGSFTPEFSWGTHFFADLEADRVLYMPVIDGAPGNLIDWRYFAAAGAGGGSGGDGAAVGGVAAAGGSTADAHGHPAVRVYRGDFAVYMDASRPLGVVTSRGWE